MDISLTRRLNLRRIIDNAISMGIAKHDSDFAKSKDLDPSYISQLINGHRNIGERSARNLENKLGLEKGALDKIENEHNSDNDRRHENTNSNYNIEINNKIKNNTGRWVPVKVFNKMGIDGYFTDLNTNEQVDAGYIPSLTASDAAYAIRANGGLLHPAIRDGWYVVCDPNAKPVPTEYVQVNLRDGRKSIKEFIVKTADLLVLQDVSSGSRITFQSDEVDSIIAIIDIVPPSRHLAQIPITHIN